MMMQIGQGLIDTPPSWHPPLGDTSTVMFLLFDFERLRSSASGGPEQAANERAVGRSLLPPSLRLHIHALSCTLTYVTIENANALGRPRLLTSRQGRLCLILVACSVQILGCVQ